MIGIGVNIIPFISKAARAVGDYIIRVTSNGGVSESTQCVNTTLSQLDSQDLLDSASLVMIPSGYKSGIAYAQIPTNGNGDLTWTRASTALRTNSSGLLESMGSGVPRLSYMYGSCPALLLEPQRTNLVLYSAQFDNAWWSKTATVTSNTTISPSGSQDADTFTDSSNSYDDVRSTSISITANATYTASVFIKKTTGTLTHYPGIGILLSGITNRLDFGILNTTTGQVVRDGSSNINVATYSTQSVGDYWRLILTFTDNLLNTNCGIYFYPAISTNGTSISPTAQGSNVFWGAQLELGAYATTIIPTTTASATRIADSFSRNNIYTNGLITSSGGTWFVELRGNVAYTRDAFGAGLYISDTTNISSNNINIRNGGTSRLAINKVIAGVSTALYLTTTDTTKLAIKWNGTSADIFANGTKVISATAFTPTAMQFLSCDATDVPKFIQAMALYSSPLSDTDCTTITSL